MLKKLITFCFALLICSCTTLKRNSYRQSSSVTPKKASWFTQIVADSKHLKPEKRVEVQERKIKHIQKPAYSNGQIFIKDIHTKKVQFWMNYLGKKERARFQRFINNGEKYREIIEQVFKEYDLPKELYFVGLIESGFYLGAKSRASAVGPWQFMRSTAKMYKLKVNRHVDERRNIFKSTQAAAKHYKYLYNIFGSWELALAAYNKGENGVIRRIRKGQTRDYYQLCRMKLLPKETRNYIPKILAAMKLYANPSKYGLVIPNYKNSIYDNTRVVSIKRSQKVSKLARKFQLSTKQLKNLNPELIGAYTPNYRRSTLDIRVPNINYSSDMLAKLNQRQKGSLLKRSRRKIASRKKRASRSKRKINKSKKNFVYKVQRGDNLSRISSIFNVRVKQIKSINRLKKSSIFIGQKIKIPKTTFKTYVVRSGDNLTKIASRFGTSPRRLAQINRLRNSKIFPGQRISVVQKI